IARWAGQGGTRRSGGRPAVGAGTQCAGFEPHATGTTAQERAGEGGAGVVAAGLHGGVAAVVEPAAGDGALDTGEPGGEPVEAASGAQAGAASTPPATAGLALEKGPRC